MKKQRKSRRKIFFDAPVDLIGEEWRDVKEFEGLYQVSNMGRVKSFVKYKEGIIMKGGLVNSGYFHITLHKHPMKKQFLIHRLVAFHFIPNPENKGDINHINCIKGDNRAENLEWNTRSENIRHAYANNLGNYKTEKNINQARAVGKANGRKVIDSNSGVIYDSIKDAAISIGYSPCYLALMLSGYFNNKTSFVYYKPILSQN